MPTLALARRSPARLARDPQRTRDRILAAALAEFSAEGFAGARVARIARRARINKRMLYHYFGNKEDLFREILDRKLRERSGWRRRGAGRTWPRASRRGSAWRADDREFIRLIQWEALGDGDGPVLREPERRASSPAPSPTCATRQEAGLLPSGLDARLLLLAILGLVTYPLVFPQVTRLVMGRTSSDAVFHRDWTAFLRELSAALSGRRA